MLTFLMAALLSFGSIAPARVVSALCASGQCGEVCGMHKPTAPKEPTSCCAKKKAIAEKASKQGCQCEIKSLPDSSSTPTAIALHIDPVPVIAMPAAPALAVFEPLSPLTEIYFSGDSSPPDPRHHPDSSRAPPAA